ncbi:MAG TPA: hypothetical protein PKN87_02945 [Syntrophomonadaceae bacterium]|nr:hypothetical protein [Syntrophomonadaceae bacterium]HNX28353.1 hypothetical protein [Syntrophomonadaceae bacterium]HPR92715.1 hypothetical protein [Syntrophomonadaceae bacterium]
MHKKIPALFLLLTFLLLPAGCDQTAETASSTVNTAAETVAIPSEEPALTGRVKEITGNEVTIYEMTAPVDNRMDAQDKSSPAIPGNNQVAPPVREKPLDEVTAESVRTETDSAVQEGASLTDVPVTEATEETTTFLIPAGAQIVGMSTGQEGASLLSLSDISTGSMIKVWKTGDTITMVQIMGGQATQTRETETENEQMMPGGPDMGGGGPPGMGGGSGITQGL